MARPRLSWWEHFGRYHDHLTAAQFAVPFFSRAIPRRKLAQLHGHRRRPEDARQAYEALLRYDGDDADALLELGKLALRKGDVGASRAYFQKLLSASSDEVAARIQVAFAFLEAKKQKDALEIVGFNGAGDKFAFFSYGIRDGSGFPHAELVVKAMENISEIARDNLSTVEEMSKATSNLALQAENLAKLISVFRVQ